jgi:hypothetical protein
MRIGAELCLYSPIPTAAVSLHELIGIPCARTTKRRRRPGVRVASGRKPLRPSSRKLSNYVISTGNLRMRYRVNWACRGGGKAPLQSDRSMTALRMLVDAATKSCDSDFPGILTCIRLLVAHVDLKSCSNITLH